MIGTNGQKAKNVDEAVAFIGSFIRYEVDHAAEINRHKDHDFDLYLPWMMEVVVNSEEDPESQTPTSLDSLYMDAAWALVLDGKLRPGPRTVSGENPGDGYGKGFTLTKAGHAWIDSFEKS